jgi:hypothetical protein
VGKAKAGLGVDWLGKVKAADGSTEGESLPCCSLWRVDTVGLDEVWSGGVRQGWVRQGNSCRQQHGGLRLSLLLSLERADMVGSGQVRLGRLGNGWVRLGRAIVADGSTGAFGLFCCSPWRVVLARCVLARTDWVGPGSASFGKAIVADGSTELRKKFPAALFRE